MQHGFNIQGNDNSLSSNTASNNTQDGFRFEGDRNTLTSNTGTGNTQDADVGGRTTGNTCTGNTLGTTDGSCPTDFP